MVDSVSLSIFDTFKTKSLELTGEAMRQRSIIATLTAQSSPTERTRTSISKRIAKEGGKVWKNIYSGIFRDLDEILIPLDLVEEEGRLPLKRGPKALQEKGIPYYRLTSKGQLVSLSLSEIIHKDEILKNLLDDIQCDAKFKDSMTRLAEIAPKFAYHIIEKYVRAYCTGQIGDLLPLGFESLKTTSDESIAGLKEILEAFEQGTKRNRDSTMYFLEQISSAKH